ncbi:hypothetical protein T439DRAFT_378333 [Meredithblackwellia eburnea MCA 4105]
MTAGVDERTKATQNYSKLSFFVLPGLPAGSEAGIDGNLWTVSKFNGFKLIPPGLHLIVCSAAPSSSSSASDSTPSSGVGVRHGVLRFFSTTPETVFKEWDNNAEEFVLPVSASEDGQRQRKRRRVDLDRTKVEGTVVSEERLKGLDSTLAAYPNSSTTSWSRLTNFITEGTLLRVVGAEEGSGDFVVDAVMGTSAELDDFQKDSKRMDERRTWGKERDPVESQDGGYRVDWTEGEDDVLRFVSVDLKRSWPTGATGMELSRWSQDKSWLLSNCVKKELGGDAKQLLSEFQLSFILLTNLHNFSSLSVYKTLFTLFCRSSTLLRPAHSRPPSNSNPALLTDEPLPLYVSLIKSFHTQLESLPSDFFAIQLTALEPFLLTELDALRQNLEDASPAWLSLPPSLPATEVWHMLIKEWDAMISMAMEKFGWDVGVVRGGKKVVEGRERVEGELDWEELEEGEDAPVIVEL